MIDKVTVKHNHEVYHTVTEAVKHFDEAKCRLRETVDKGLKVRARQVYEGILNSQPSPVKAKMPSAVKAANSLNLLKRGLECYPKPPQDLDDLLLTIYTFFDTDDEDIIDDMYELQSFLKYRNTKFISILQKGDDIVLLFSYYEGLERLFYATRWFADGTFGIVPLLFEQLWTIHTAEGPTGMGVPALFALTTHRTKVTYSMILDWLEVRMRRFSHLWNWNEIKFTSDYESGLIPVLREKNISIIGCWFHYSDCLRRFIDKNGLRTRYEDEQKGYPLRLAILRFRLLPFLPLENVKMVATYLLQHLPPSLQNAGFAKYFQETWLWLYKPDIWNIHVDVADLIHTNNLAEGYHNGLDVRNGENHMEFWRMVRGLQREFDKAETDIVQTNAGQRVRTQVRVHEKTLKQAAMVVISKKLDKMKGQGQLELEDYVKFLDELATTLYA